MNERHLDVRGVSKTYGQTVALREVDFSVKAGEIACLLGPSGCGKTTVLRVIAGLERPNEGCVLLGSRDITSLPAGKRNFGIVFQNYALFPNLTVYRNVAYGLQGKGLRPQGLRAKVADVLELVGLTGLDGRYPAQLSGGQQQRVALARALVLSPDLLLLDEPLSALDAKVRLRLRSEIRELQQRLGVTTIVVTHDQEEALTMADTVIVMRDGRVEQTGTPREIYDHPATPFVADFVGTVNFFRAADVNPALEPRASIVGIRPEHIRVSANGQAGGACAVGMPALLKQVEFCGAYCRMTLETDARDAAESYSVTVSTPADVARRPEFSGRSRLCLEFPEDRLLLYDDGNHLFGQSLVKV